MTIKDPYTIKETPNALTNRITPKTHTEAFY
jgi:hypothetical protein